MCVFFFFQAEDGIRDPLVTGVQTCALPIYAEVIAHLIAAHYGGELAEAVRAAYRELEGHFAFVAMALDEPRVLVGARKECPLVIGRGDGEQFVASAVPAFLAETRRVQVIENGEVVRLTPAGVTITTAEIGRAHV